MIKYLALATVAALYSCAAGPAFAQDCMPAEDALANLAANGYEPTFTDTSGEFKFILAEDGKGGWVMIVIVGDKVCPVVGGHSGVHRTRKPNA